MSEAKVVDALKKHRSKLLVLSIAVVGQQSA
jgi:hypothetical protein